MAAVQILLDIVDERGLPDIRDFTYLSVEVPSSLPPKGEPDAGGQNGRIPRARRLSSGAIVATGRGKAAGRWSSSPAKQASARPPWPGRSARSHAALRELPGASASRYPPPAHSVPWSRSQSQSTKMSHGCSMNRAAAGWHFARYLTRSVPGGSRRCSSSKMCTGRTGPCRSTRANPAGLTERETEILHLVAEDLSNADIARRLYLALKTVEHHVSSVLSKLGAQTRGEAVKEGVRRGFIRFPSQSDA